LVTGTHSLKPFSPSRRFVFFELELVASGFLLEKLEISLNFGKFQNKRFMERLKLQTLLTIFHK